jgi:hypothetical protein
MGSNPIIGLVLTLIIVAIEGSRGFNMPLSLLLVACNR